MIKKMIDQKLSLCSLKLCEEFLYLRHFHTSYLKYSSGIKQITEFDGLEKHTREDAAILYSF